MKKDMFSIPEGAINAATLFGVLAVFEKANAYAFERGEKPFSPR